MLYITTNKGLKVSFRTHKNKFFWQKEAEYHAAEKLLVNTLIAKIIIDLPY
jgi:hypothetical protein